jgi:hypothetical protein
MSDGSLCAVRGGESEPAILLDEGETELIVLTQEEVERVADEVIAAWAIGLAAAATQFER